MSLITKITNKAKFIGLLPSPIAKAVLILLINFDNIFWKLRLNLFLAIKGKNTISGKALHELKQNGATVIESFVNENEIKVIRENCQKLFDDLPKNLKNGKNIPNVRVMENEENIFFEKFNNSFKLKGLEKLKGFNYFSIKNKEQLNSIILTYSLSKNNPFLIYNFSVADKDNIEQDVIAGEPHLDSPFRSLRGCLLLEDVDDINGPTIYFKKSSENSQVKKIHHNHLFNQFNLNKSSGKVHLVNDEVLDDEFKKNYQTISLTGKKGDLVLLDLKSVHYASKIKKGERHLLWLYY